MSTASEKAAAFLTENTDERPTGERRDASGEYARLRDLILQDELTDDESAEFAELAKKRRAGTLTGSPTRTVFKRPSTAGERSEVDVAPKPPTASEQAAAYLQGRSS